MPTRSHESPSALCHEGPWVLRAPRARGGGVALGTLNPCPVASAQSWRCSLLWEQADIRFLGCLGGCSPRSRPVGRAGIAQRARLPCAVRNHCASCLPHGLTPSLALRVPALGKCSLVLICSSLRGGKIGRDVPCVRNFG